MSRVFIHGVLLDSAISAELAGVDPQQVDPAKSYVWDLDSGCLVEAQLNHARDVDYAAIEARLAAALGMHAEQAAEAMRRFGQAMRDAQPLQAHELFSVDDCLSPAVQYAEPRRKRAQWKDEPKQYGPKRHGGRR